MAEAQSFLDKADARWASGEQATFAIVDTTHGHLLGGVDVGEIDGSTGDVGYWLAVDARGRGIASRAVRLVCGWAFDALGLERLTLLAEPANDASQRVAERCGFRRDVLLTAHDVDWRDGRSRDFWRFVLDRPQDSTA